MDRRHAAHLPVGVGHQAGHRTRRPGGRGGGHAGPRRPGRAHRVDGAPPAGPCLGPRPRARAARRGARGPADLLERRLRGAGRGARQSAAGMPFADYLAEAVLEPLGMTGTTGPSTRRPGRRPPDWPVRWPTSWPWPREWARPTLVSPATWRRPRRCSSPVWPVCCRDSARSTRATGDSGSRCGATSGPTGPGRRTRRPPTATSGSPARSSGSTRWPACCAAGLADRPFGVWAARAWPALADAVLAAVGARSAGAARRGGGGRPESEPVRTRPGTRSRSTPPTGPRLGFAP